MKIKMVRDMIKARKDHYCYYCRNKIPKGSYCFGKSGNYAKICLICKRDKDFPNRISRLKQLIRNTKNDMTMLNNNLNKYERVNILAKLENA